MYVCTKATRTNIMSVHEIDDDNATSDNVCTIHTTHIYTNKSIEHSQQLQQAWGRKGQASIRMLLLWEHYADWRCGIGFCDHLTKSIESI